MAGEGGRGVQPDLKRENVRHVRNFISATPLNLPTYPVCRAVIPVPPCVPTAA